MNARDLGSQSVHPELLAAPSNDGYLSTAGLTKREAFAMAAMQGLITRGYDSEMRGYSGWQEEFSRESIRFADALLAELAKDGAA